MSSAKPLHEWVKFGFLLIVALTQAHRGQASTGQFAAEDYALLVHRYMMGHSRAAVRELAGHSPENLEEVCEEYGERWLTTPQLKAAALLHTEAILFEDGDFKFHTSAARRWMRGTEFGSDREFERRWFLLMAYYFMGTGQVWEARAILESALLDRPEDKAFRLALGTVLETVGWIRKDGASLGKAEEQYRFILDEDSGFAEARLRLGRVLALRGRTDEALTELNRVLSTTEDKQLRLVCYLTIGVIHEEREDLEDALQSFKRAIALDPKCQSAAIALAHAQHRMGDREVSRRILEKFLEQDEVGVSGDEDLWFRYIFGHSHRFGAFLRDLRSEVHWMR